MKYKTPPISGETGHALFVVLILVFSMFIFGAGFFSMVGH